MMVMVVMVIMRIMIIIMMAVMVMVLIALVLFLKTAMEVRMLSLNGGTGWPEEASRRARKMTTTPTATPPTACWNGARVILRRWQNQYHLLPLHLPMAMARR